MMATMKRRRRQKVGILGGTFNPIHIGHLLIAQDALEQAGLDRVVFIPSATPPHKRLEGNASARQRLAMVEAAVAGNEAFAVDDLEIRRGGASYTVETLTELRRREPGADFYFIIGSDSLPELTTWKDFERLAKLCRFVVVTRPGFEPGKAPKPVKPLVVFGHMCDVASRDVRARRRRGQSIRYLVPEAVVRYIARRKLYL